MAEQYAERAEGLAGGLAEGILVEVVLLALGTAELARGGTRPVAERRRAFAREYKRRALAKAPPMEGEHAAPPPELQEKSSVVAKPFASIRGTHIPNDLVPEEKWLPSSAPANWPRQLR